MRRLGLVLLLAASVAVAVTGCGGGGSDNGGGPPLTKAEYETKIKSIAKDIGGRLGNTLDTAKKNSKEAIEQAVTAIEELVAQLKDINPPAEIAHAHGLLVDGLRALADDLPGLLDKLEKAKDPGAAFALILGLKSFQKLLQAQKEFKEKGYKVDFDS